MAFLIAVLVIGLIGAGVVGGAAALAIRSKDGQQDMRVVVPGARFLAPIEWAGSHSTEARLHRRLRESARGALAQPGLQGTSSLATLTETAITLDEQLAAAAALPAAHRDGALAKVENMIARYETSVAEAATSAIEAGTNTSSFEASMRAIEIELDALNAARDEVEEADGQA